MRLSTVIAIWLSIIVASCGAVGGRLVFIEWEGVGRAADGLTGARLVQLMSAVSGRLSAERGPTLAALEAEGPLAAGLRATLDTARAASDFAFDRVAAAVDVTGGPAGAAMLAGSTKARLHLAVVRLEIEDLLARPLAARRESVDAVVDGLRSVAAELSAGGQVMAGDGAAAEGVAVAAAALHRSRLSLVLSGLGVLLTGGATAAGMWLFARRVAGPARRLTATILALAAGDRSIEVPLRGRADELGQIARAIETLRCNALLAESIGVRLLEMQHMRAEDKARLLSETTQTNQRLTALNLELKSLAATDALTGVANRRGFDLVLAREWSRAARDQLPLALLLLDVDYFKTFNDRYGHPAGDDCLAWVAAAIGGAARRPGDVVARYGGEEFAVVLPATTLESAGVVAENIRLAVAAVAIPHPDNPCGCVTVSLGMSGIFPGESASAEMLVSQADAGLYRAKSGGRNRIGTSGDVAYQTAG